MISKISAVNFKPASKQITLNPVSFKNSESSTYSQELLSALEILKKIDFKHTHIYTNAERLRCQLPKYVKFLQEKDDKELTIFCKEATKEMENKGLINLNNKSFYRTETRRDGVNIITNVYAYICGQNGEDKTEELLFRIENGILQHEKIKSCDTGL